MFSGAYSQKSLVRTVSYFKIKKSCYYFFEDVLFSRWAILDDLSKAVVEGFSIVEALSCLFPIPLTNRRGIN